MDAQSNTIRELTNEECESTSGGLWFAVAVLVGAAAAGSLLAYCTTEREEEVLIPDIQFPS
jgi:lactobin A/cerein 7B family class IIb bacteriocin